MNIKILIISFILLVFSCTQEKNPDSLSIQNQDFLTDSQLTVIDNMASQNISLDKIVLPNGAVLSEFMNEIDSVWMAKYQKGTDPYSSFNANQIKNILLAKFLIFGSYLTNRNNFQYTKESLSKPAQNGLAYTYGGKDYTIRRKPTEGECTDELYGLDCSGMISQIFNNSGLNTPKEISAFNQHQPTVLQKALNEFPSMSKLKVTNLGKLIDPNIESGDIVYWSKIDGTKGSHIGMVIKDSNGTLYVYQSNGTSLKSKDCDKNYGLNRGPRTLKLSDGFWFSSNSNWEIVRMEAFSTDGVTVNNNNLAIGGCYGTGSCGRDANGKRNYPCQIPAQACGGNPPYTYKLNNGSWTSNCVFSIYKDGIYVVTVKDNLGFYASKTFTYN